MDELTAAGEMGLLASLALRFLQDDPPGDATAILEHVNRALPGRADADGDGDAITVYLKTVMGVCRAAQHGQWRVAEQLARAANRYLCLFRARADPAALQTMRLATEGFRAAAEARAPPYATPGALLVVRAFCLETRRLDS